MTPQFPVPRINSQFCEIVYKNLTKANRISMDTQNKTEDTEPKLCKEKMNTVPRGRTVQWSLGTTVYSITNLTLLRTV